jgi:hypothetical protein
VIQRSNQVHLSIYPKKKNETNEFQLVVRVSLHVVKVIFQNHFLPPFWLVLHKGVHGEYLEGGCPAVPAWGTVVCSSWHKMAGAFNFNGASPLVFQGHRIGDGMRLRSLIHTIQQ